MTELLAMIEVTTVVHEQQGESEECNIGVPKRHSDVKKDMTGMDTIGEVGIQMENEAGGKQMLEQGVHRSFDKEKYVAGGKQEQEQCVCGGPKDYVL